MYKKIMIGLTTLVVLNGYVMMEVFDYYDSLYSNRIGSYENTIKKLEEVVDEFKLEGLDVTVTMYHPTTEQTDSTPDVLADGTRIRVHSASDYKFVAVSRNLLKKHGGWLDYGDFILLRGTDGKDGVYQVKDTMNRRFVNRIDILESPGTEPYKFDNAKILKTSIETDFTFINN
jgi:3D (Asp-Asp-Asp) domain-containing protein|tara:strand:- start:1 stop:522 length:522 start_codon:yes stop_codon:yes gene_type:complete